MRLPWRIYLEHSSWKYFHLMDGRSAIYGEAYPFLPSVHECRGCDFLATDLAELFRHVLECQSTSLADGT